MRQTRIWILAAVLGGLIAFPTLADAQGRAAARGGGGGGGGRPAGGGGGGGRPGGAVGAPGHAVPRPGPAYPGHYAPYRGGYYAPYRGYYYGGYPWYGGYYGYPYGLSFGIGFGYPYGYASFGYGYGYPYPAYGAYYAYPGYAARSYGGVRIVVPRRDAEVYVDNYYAGVVDDFDGSLQQVNLEPGPHEIAIRAEGAEPITFQVNVEPGRTITYRAALRQAQP